MLDGSPFTPEELIEVLGTDYNLQILVAAREPIAAHDLIEEGDMPRTTVYRRLDELSKHGFIEETGEVKMDGKHHTLYHCNLERLELDLVGGDIAASVTYRTAPHQEHSQDWGHIPLQDR